VQEIVEYHGRIICHPAIKNDSGAILSGRSGGNIFTLQYRTRSLPETAHNPRNRVNQCERNQE
jgi:hypothetical protein